MAENQTEKKERERILRPEEIFKWNLINNRFIKLTILILKINEMYIICQPNFVWLLLLLQHSLVLIKSAVKYRIGFLHIFRLK